MRRLPLALAAITFVALFATSMPVGFVRDEGYYFEAAKSYEAWVQLLLRSPLAAARLTQQYWWINAEHPGLAKLLFALSHLVFATWLRILPDALAWRVPGFFFGALLTYWLAVLGGNRGDRMLRSSGSARRPGDPSASDRMLRPSGSARRPGDPSTSGPAAILAPALFWCAERTFFHGHLAAFDVPICALWAGTGVAWARALGLLPGADAPGAPDGEAEARNRARRAGVWLGFVFGCALAVKHNAWLLPPILLVHALLLPAALRRRALRTLGWLALGPVVLFATWPLLWHDPIRHLADWISFHTHHVHYAWYYLGRELRAPPFPVAYPLVVLALALPLPQVVLGAAAGLRLLWDFAARRIDPLRLLELGLAGGAIFPFLLRTWPIFGGIKHWLAFYALLMPEAAQLCVEVASLAAAAGVGWLTARRAVGIAAAASLLPGLWQIIHVHPYGTSAYGEIAGGIPGAASLGMQRQYWSNNVTSVLPWLNTHAPRGARVFFHEVNFESYRAYQQAGMLRADIQYANGPWDAQYAAIQWHREFRDREPDTWNAFGTKKPATGLYLDETPQVIVYARPGLPGAP